MIADKKAPSLEEQRLERLEHKKVQQDFAQLTADMWAYLKNQSKKDLMRLVIQQANLVIEHTQLNKHLYEENEALKKELEALKPTEQSEAAEGNS